MSVPLDTRSFYRRLTRSWRCAGVLLAAVLLCAGIARGAPSQGPGCQPAWVPTFGPTPGTSGFVHAMATFDDGSGPELYVAGDFTAAFGIVSNNIVKWNGSQALAVGSGFGGRVRALLVFDDGSGPALYAGGDFGSADNLPALRVARWNGSTWSQVGAGLRGASATEVRALAVFDDGTGPALYAGGEFTTEGTGCVAKWNGTSWGPVGIGLQGRVHALAVYDDGTGPALYAGGEFNVGSSSAIAKWNGSTWVSVGAGLSHEVHALTAYDDGTGPALYAGGTFESGSFPGLFNHVARWNGTTWSSVGGGIGSLTQHDVVQFIPFDDGSGPALYAAGNFTIAGGQPANHVARWNGSAWTAVGNGTGDRTWALCGYDDGSGPTLFAGGEFRTAGAGAAYYVAKWNPTGWHPLVVGLDGYVKALETYDEGNGPKLFAAGTFTSYGNLSINRIARWDGTAWSPLGAAMNDDVLALARFDDGSGEALYAAGTFTTAGGVVANHIARWDGIAWQPVGGGTNGEVWALLVFDDGTGRALYAGGSFSIAGGVPANRIAKWNGSVWQPLPGILGGLVTSMAVFDDGGGPALFVGGGEFGGVSSMFRIRKWNGSSWTALGSGITDGYVRALATYDDGSGPALFAGGQYNAAGGVFLYCLGKWNGTSWAPTGLASGFPNGVTVLGLSVLDLGSGPALFVGGAFTSAGGILVNNLAVRNGSQWSALGSGMYGNVEDFELFDDGTGTALFVSGGFPSAIDSGDSVIAKWGLAAPCPPGTGYCFGFTGCPCGNNSGMETGCLNSLGIGSRLDATGVASLAADSVVLHGSGMTDSFALYLQGTEQTSGGSGLPFGDGLRCLAGQIVRLGRKQNVSGSSRYPDAGDPTISASGLIGSPGTRNYQAWYRNLAPFCTPAGHNLTNGWQITWSP